MKHYRIKLLIPVPVVQIDGEYTTVEAESLEDAKKMADEMLSDYEIDSFDIEVADPEVYSVTEIEPKIFRISFEHNGEKKGFDYEGFGCTDEKAEELCKAFVFGGGVSGVAIEMK